MSDRVKLAVIVLVCAAAIGLFVWAMSAFGKSAQEWIESISDPTERGLAYVAAAIVVHAFFGSSRKIEVEVKK